MVKFSPPLALSTLALATTLLLSACAPFPTQTQGLQLETPQGLAPNSNRTALSVEATWWKTYQDGQLNQLVTLALASSPNLQAAKARLLQAQATANLVDANSGMSLTAVADATRQKFSANYIYPPPLGGSIWNSADALLSLSTNFDWWGKNRHQLVAAIGQVDAEKAEDAEAANALSAAVVKTYFQWQWQSARLTLLESIVKETRQLVSINQQRIGAGLEATGSQESLRAELAAAEQEIIRSQTARQQAKVQLQALIGNTVAVPALQLRALPTALVQVPTNVTLDAIARRPDIAAAKARAESGMELVAASKTDFYPNINITALVGYTSLGFSNLFKSSSFNAGITPAIHLPIFDAGRIRANLFKTRADAELSVATYNQKIASAAAEVGDATARLQGQMQEVQRMREQVQARKQDLQIAQKKQKQGLIDGRDSRRLSIVFAQVQDKDLATQLALLQSNVDLIKALGGGYNAPNTHAETTNTLAATISAVAQ